MSGKRTKSLRKVFIASYPQFQFNRAAWRQFKRDYSRSSRALRKAFLDQ